jgi:hypothetical protein
VVALRDRGFPVEYMLAPDEGHGFARPVNNMALFMAAEKFLAKHLGGRYQEGGTPEVTARLKELMVDPKTVMLTKAAEPAAGAPSPAADLQPGSFKYQASIAVGTQQMNLQMTTTIKEENQAWTITDTTEGQMGTSTDTTVVEKGSLIVRNRSVQQGPVSIKVDFAGGKASGAMSMSGQDRPIAADLGGPLFADGAGAYQCVAQLPLAEGFATTFRNFDLRSQKVKVRELKVTGMEKVTVPAGTFEAYKVELTFADGGADKTTLWIAKDSRKVARIAAVLSQLGGATLTAELMP